MCSQMLQITDGFCAGTCIIYPTGDWYGKLIPCDVQNIVEQCFVQKKVIRSKWRGRPPVVKNTL